MGEEIKERDILGGPRLAWMLIGIGIVLRLAQFRFNRSLWLDESFLALNIVDRSLGQLMQPLDYDQGAPLGFLALVKMTQSWLPDLDMSLRLVPLLASIVSLVLFYAVCQRTLSKKAVPIALALFAFSDALIYYASEVKQYSFDVMVALIVTLATLRLIERDMTRNRIIGFAALGVVLLWFSHAAVFCLGGVGACLIARAWRAQNQTEFKYMLWVAGSWAASLLILYFISLRHLRGNEMLHEYWAGRNGYAPLIPRSMDDLKWPFETLFSIIRVHLGDELWGIAPLLMILGVAVAFLKRRFTLSILLAPIALCLFASVLGQYPFSGRLILFIAPVVLLLIAEGTFQIVSNFRPEARFLGVAFLLTLFFFPAGEAAKRMIVPREEEEIRTVLGDMKEKHREGDTIYLYGSAERPYQYYAPRFDLPIEELIVGIRARKNWNAYYEDLEQVAGKSRVWIVFSHIWTFDGVNEETLFLNYLDEHGTRIERIKAEGASAYLYDMSGDPAPTSQSSADKN